MIAGGSPASLAIGYTGGGILALCLVPQVGLCSISGMRSERERAVAHAVLATAATTRQHHTTPH